MIRYLKLLTLHQKKIFSTNTRFFTSQKNSQKINRSAQYSFETFPILKNYKPPPELNMSYYTNKNGHHNADKIESIARSPYLNQGK